MPSTFNLNKVEEIKATIESADAIWIVDYRGLSVKETESLRIKLRETKSSMKIFKNTLTKLALDALELPTLDDILAGPSGFIFVNGDPVASAKALKDFGAEFKALEIKGGLFDGKEVSQEQVIKIASLPSKEQLIAKLLGTIQNPITGFVRVINAVPEKAVRAINEIAKQKAA